MPHGGSIPALTYHITGFVNGDLPSVVRGTPVLSTTATTTSPAGRYPISAAVDGLEADNYVFTTALPGTLTIRPKVVDVRVLWGSRSMSILELDRDLPFSNIQALEVIFSDDVSLNKPAMFASQRHQPGKRLHHRHLLVRSRFAPGPLDPPHPAGRRPPHALARRR